MESSSKKSRPDKLQHLRRILKKKKKVDENVFSIEDAREAIQKHKVLAAEEKAASSVVKEKPENKKWPLPPSSAAKSAPQKVGAASIADILGFNPVGVSKQSVPRDKDPEEIPAKYRKYYKLLLKLKHDVKVGLSKLTNENLAMSVGEKKKHKEDPDVESFDSDFALGLMSNEQEALTEIQEAIQRIYDGTYGICQLTGKPIEPKRLLAVPFTRFSIEGQMGRERQQKQKEINRSSVFQEDSGADMDDFAIDGDE